MKRYLVRFRELVERLDDRMLVDDGERSLSYAQMDEEAIDILNRSSREARASGLTVVEGCMDVDTSTKKRTKKVS